ncbi:MAG: hypothetical protein AAFR26_00005, partial [Cyanobacteria bacterium J06626_4]
SLLGVCLISGFLMFVAGEVYLLNNQILSEHERSFRRNSHPINTSAVAFKRLVTHPPGNGSHCFYFVGEVRTFSGDRKHVAGFYAGKQVQLEFFEQGQLQSFPYVWLSQLPDWVNSQANSSENYYLIYSLNSKIDDYTSFDWRCN